MSEDVHALVREAAADSSGRIRAAARLMTLVENEPERLPELFAGLPRWPEPRMVVGLTGPPGSGKSVLADQLIAKWRAHYPDRRVGVIAADPSSPFTGGAFLGDRVRMMRHAGDPLVFTRSTVSRGHVGGLTAGVRGMIRIMGLIKCDVVLIETVGGGQSDVEVASVVDLVVVVLAPGQGDSIQLLKSGLMEAGDIYVVNKADQEGAAQLCARALAIAPLISRHGHQGQATPVCLVSALQDRGVAELRDQIEACFEQDHDRWQARRREAITQEVTAAILEESRRQIFQALQADGAATEQIHRVLRGEVAIPDLVRTLLQNIVAHAPQGA